MKTIKPSNMVLFFKTNVLEQKNVLSISASAIFSLNHQNQQIIEAHEFTKFIDKNLASGEIFDLGVPKPRAEFLVYGACYTPQPVKGIGIQVSVGDMTKNLVVIGHRQWSYVGTSSAEEFTTMPINYAHAFGGKDYAYNPLGKGYMANSEQLPNVEDPDHPIINKSDCPQPAGFNAYPLIWPQRMKFVAKIDDSYLQESWPHLPKGTNPEYFNTAPFDQRLNGFFRGDEKIIIKNMHPDKSTQHSQLPGLRARIFVIQKTTNDQEAFKEVISRAETLWLFPNQDAGILLYRANLEIADEDFSDINKLYAVWEKLTDPPQSLEYYLAQLQAAETQIHETVPPMTARATDAAAPKVDVNITPITAKAPPEFKPEINSAMAEAKKELEKVKADLEEKLKKSNTNAEEMFKKLQAQTEHPNNTVDLNVLNKQFQAQAADLMKKNQLTAEDVEKLIAKHTPAEANLDDFLLKYSNSNLPGDFIDKLKEFKESLKAKLAKNEEDLAAMAEKVVTPPQPTDNEPTQKAEEPILNAKQISVADVLQKYKIDKNLSQLDLSGLDFSKCDLYGADFSNSILDKAIFKEAKLDQAVLNNSRLNETDFSNASLNFALFSNVNAYQSKFCQANLSNSTITNSGFSKCDFSTCILNKASLVGNIVEHCSFNFSQVIGISSTKDLFTYCNLSDADFTQANLTKSDFSNSIIDRTNFSDCYAPELRLNSVKGTSPCFENSCLTASRASKDTRLNRANFKMAQINYALWEGAQLPEVNLTKAVLDHSNFSHCLLDKAMLELALAKNTNFAKSQFIAGNLNRINLFKGSLRGANLKHANLSYSNLYGVDFYQAKLGETNFKGANLNRTLLSFL